MGRFDTKSDKLMKIVSEKQKSGFYLVVVLIVLQIVTHSNPVFAKIDPTLYIHDKKVMTDTKPFIENNRTMVPIRVIAENLGYSVKWNGQNNEVVISNKDKVLKLYIGKQETLKNGNKILIDAAPTIKNNRTFVPLRYIAETFNQVVIWDSGARNVHITREKDIPNDENDYAGRFVLINNIDLSKQKNDKKLPESLKIGDVGLIIKSESDYLYVDLIKPVGDAIEDWSFAKGYILKKDCILNPTPKELDLISNVCRLRNGQIKIKDSVNGQTYEVEGNKFVQITKKEKDRVRIEMCGGANDAWVSKNDVDFNFEYFIGNPENTKKDK